MNNVSLNEIDLRVKTEIAVKTEAATQYFSKSPLLCLFMNIKKLSLYILFVIRGAISLTDN